ncbi:hypothetical protein Q4491_05100 [Photobacterium sp. 2_MG-2023]|uniref:hypothetical protein n=1 Tax=Photobacterium sp. 2_MG-2023 TaxID=3062663 RepID=UPI0026E39941|nr:hypothetical protein [Photobacterium sp. 2_MG-2023]MDO6580718.1 hypothetical protein [Photobacterium sp. 2_MG-2023]
MKLSRKGWNNIIIIGVLLFVAIIQLQSLPKERMAGHEPQAANTAGLVRLLPPDAQVTRLALPNVAFTQSAGQWQSEPVIAGDPSAIVANWQDVAGTKIDSETFAQLNDKLASPRSVEVWLENHEEPYRLTVYQLPQFWLLQNWQGEWLAITVEASYLFPEI